ncbi:MAG: tripartite tricarboxylate transporter substrate binding protein [Burkholderiaceae bacterium]
MKARLALWLACLLAFSGATQAQTQPYPNRPIKIVVPYAPGGPVDVLSRLVAQRLTERIGQSVVIDNRAGGSTVIGTDIVAKAPPDGYTIMMGTVSSHAMNPAIAAKLPYDVVADFAPVSLVASMPMVLVVHPAVQASSIKELIALSKASKGGLSYGSAGSGTSNHFAAELFKTMAGVEAVHVPYKGMAPAQVDLMGGRLTMMFDTTITAMPYVEKGQMKALAITTPERAPFAPNLPTIAESGVPGYAVDVWFGVFAPAKTPPEIVDRLNAEIREVMKVQEIVDRLKGLGAVPRTDTPKQFAAFVAAEAKKWATVARDAGITAN